MQDAESTPPDNPSEPRLPHLPLQDTTNHYIPASSKTVDQEVLLRELRIKNMLEEEKVLLQANPAFLLQFDSLFQHFTFSLKLTHARVQEAETSPVAPQLDRIETGFGMSLVRAKPLVEKSRRRKKGLENSAPLAPNPQAATQRGGRQSFRETLSQGCSQNPKR